MTGPDERSSPYPEAREYTAPEITVFYDRDRCVHFAECVRGLPAVFDVTRKPWIDPVAAAADLVADVVERCPSGALHYRMSGRVERAEPATLVQQNARGQIRLRGDLVVRNDNGGEMLHDSRISACGCGRSERRPLCDGACESDAPSN